MIRLDIRPVRKAGATRSAQVTLQPIATSQLTSGAAADDRENRLPVWLLLAVLGGCVSLAPRTGDACFDATATVGASAEPRWIRLLPPHARDTTGAASLGMDGSAALAAHWWRVGADSLRIDGASPFTGVWLRVRQRGDSLSGTAEVLTDAGSRNTVPWTAARSPCRARKVGDQPA